MRLLAISGALMAAAIVSGASAAKMGCDRYAALKWLPDSGPAVSRALGKPAPQGVNWSCRVTEPDGRRSD
jgi:hypothetical protein